MKDNRNLYRLFTADQKDRHLAILKKGELHWRQMAERDKERRRLVVQILKRAAGLTARDYYRAAMIFQHGPKAADYRRAVVLTRKAIRFGEENAKWLFAAATDRLLTKTGRKQKYGTQFRKNLENGRWHLFPVDKRISDAQRAKFNVRPLKEALAKVKELNQKEKPRGSKPRRG
jgi:hypothetical protein